MTYKESLEANKKLPKPCFGNSNGYYCNYDCPYGEDCYSATMIKWGSCNCKFKGNCHLSRQLIKSQIMEEDKNYVCGFIKYFDEETTPIMVLPEGIIKMDPIKD